MDSLGRRNHGWRIDRPVKHEVAEKISDGSEYPKGVLLTPCKAGCGKFVPSRSFHYEECPKQA